MAHRIAGVNSQPETVTEIGKLSNEHELRIKDTDEMERDELLAAFESGDMGRVEFFELALDAGMSLPEIEQALTQDDYENERL